MAMRIHRGGRWGPIVVRPVRRAARPLTAKYPTVSAGQGRRRRRWRWRCHQQRSALASGCKAAGDSASSDASGPSPSCREKREIQKKTARRDGQDFIVPGKDSSDDSDELLDEKIS